MMSKVGHLFIGFRYLHLFSVNSWLISLAHFSIWLWGFFSYSVFRSSLFICGINSRYFFSRNHLLCFFFTCKHILFSCLIYQSFVLLVLDFETRIFFHFLVKKGIHSCFLLGLNITFLLIITFSPSVPQKMYKSSLILSQFICWKQFTYHFKSQKLDAAHAIVSLTLLFHTHEHLRLCRQCKGMPVNASLCFPFTELPCATCSHEVRQYPNHQMPQKPRESQRQGILFLLHSGNEQQRKSRCERRTDSPWGQWPGRVRGIHTDVLWVFVWKREQFWQKEQLQPAAQGNSAQCPGIMGMACLVKCIQFGNGGNSFLLLFPEIYHVSHLKYFFVNRLLEE